MARDNTDKTDKTLAATREANEWGIPDWRAPAAYGLTSKTTIARWRWEFWRRRSDYREEAMQLLELARRVDDALARKMSHSSPDANCAYDALREKLEFGWNKYWQRWGYSGLMDPRVSDYPEGDLLVWAHKGVWSMKGSPAELRHPRQVRNTMTPKSDELCISLNLDRPLASQLKLAERAAKEAQVQRHGKLLQQRRHTTRWLGYLRTLDAREDGASWAEIAALHPNTAQTEQTARDIWNAADALRFSF